LSTHSLRLIEITKRFPGVRALDRVTFAADPGTIHALVGENGAGKSTLLRILGGIYQPNSGSLVIGGRERLFHSAADSIAAGVAIIHQELHYVPNLTVGENLLLALGAANCCGWSLPLTGCVPDRLDSMVSQSRFVIQLTP
jgi:L-arabinose transport system ATP-binding protein